MTTMLELAADLPEVALDPGAVLCAEGEGSGAIWVLVDGRLDVTRSGVAVNTITEPGAVIGEVGVLLGTPATATVVAASPCRLRHAADGGAFLRSHGDAATLVATGLARRLDLVTTYLADLRIQYGDAPGLAMVGTVLGRLAADQRAPARPGSARDPDPEY